MPETNAPLPPLPWLLAELKTLAAGQLHQRLADRGYPEIRDGHGCVFRFIDPDGSRLTDLAERSGYTKQAVGEVVVDLEGLGYVERMPDPADGRAKIIRLTEQGREVVAAAMAVFAEIEREWAERVGEERMATVREVLEELVLRERAPLTPA
jgi:DNA-binding MarR family transcriptional regulator